MAEIFDRFTEELNIDIHTHRVNYPTFLDMRVIPDVISKPLTKQLIEYRDSIESKTHPNWTLERKHNAIKHAQDNINALNGGDMTEHLQEFREFSDLLDKRQQVPITWRELLPKLGAYNGI
jgi:hypothetical protein